MNFNQLPLKRERLFVASPSTSRRHALTLAILAVGKIFIVINGQIINKKYGRLVTLVSGMEESAVDQSDVYCLLHGFQAILTAEFYFTK